MLYSRNNNEPEEEVIGSGDESEFKYHSKFPYNDATYYFNLSHHGGASLSRLNSTARISIKGKQNHEI